MTTIRIPCRHDGGTDAQGVCLRCGGTGHRPPTVDDLYQMIPAFNCIPGCTDCCGCNIPFSKEEWARLSDHRGLYKDKRCPYRVEGVGCAIYENRPFICRLFGCTPDLKCPHGLQPSTWMPKWKSDRATRGYVQILREEGKNRRSE